jgi:excisionase family DNA binding protein
MKTFTEIVALGNHEILSSNEACELLKISRPTLRKLANTGAIPTVRIGDKENSHRKFRLIDLVEFISKSLTSANTTTH